MARESAVVQGPFPVGLNPAPLALAFSKAYKRQQLNGLKPRGKSAAMNVTCPSCATRYSVAENMLSAAGRMMRCAQCAYTWWHHPHSAPTPQHIQAQALAQQAAAVPQAPVPVPVPVPAPEPELEEEEEEFEEPEEREEEEREEKEREEKEREEKEREEEEEVDLSDEKIEEEEEEFEEPEEREEEEREEKEREEKEREEEEEVDLSDEKIEEAFGTEEPDPIESMMDAPSDDDESEIDPDKIPDPEPLPESLTTPDGDDEDEDEDEEEGNSRIGLIIAAVAGGLLLVTLAVFVLMSKQIASWIPATSSVYESIGLNSKTLGEGLSIPGNKMQSERVTDKDSETLIVRGIIRNITKEQLALPMLRLSLFNGENKVVQTKVIKPRAPVLAGNKSIGFEIKLKDPAATARRIEVTFSEPMKGGPAAKPGKAKADTK
jgi:predicted Zn finger-like uncharacterized protein